MVLGDVRANVSPNARLSRIVIFGTGDANTILREHLQRKGYEVSVAASPLLKERGQSAPADIAILDCAAAGADVATFIARLKTAYPFTPLIVLAQPRCAALAMEALRLGAEQFLLKPVDVSVLSEVIERSLYYQRLRRRQFAEVRDSHRRLDPFVGESKAIRELADSAQRAALSEGAVLIEGERGTGKGSLAFWLHQNGRRAAEPFIELNCSRMPRRRLESEIFGDGDGSRAGTKLFPSGVLRLAHRGTTLIDGIQNINLQTQSTLLRLFGDKRSRPVSNPAHGADVRWMAASQESIAQLVKANRFRADLYSCMSGVVLRIPPLRKRLDDLPLLAAQILENLAGELGNKDFDLTQSALQVLKAYSWPGNTRELRNVLERAVLVTGTAVITARDLHLNGETTHELPGAQVQSLKSLEREYIEQILDREGWRVQAAAKRLGVPRSSLYHKLKKFQIERLNMRDSS